MTPASAQGRRALAAMPDRGRLAMLVESRNGPFTGSVTNWRRVNRGRTDSRQEAGMERADWLEAGYDTAQARFLMMTAITHHRFTSPAWGEDEIRSLHAELTEIDHSAAQVLASRRWFRGEPGGPPAGQYGLYRRRARRSEWPAQEAS